MPGPLVLLDNYDSFTHNLAQLFAGLGAEVLVVRNDEVSPDDLEALAPAWLCLSPGPGTPAEAGICRQALLRFHGRIPILGVCLGMQVLNEAFGGRTVRAPLPVHGKAHLVRHEGRGLFAGLPSPFPAARYHSLAVVPAPGLRTDAWCDDGVPMALRHPDAPTLGVQFHPESFLTEHGRELAAAFLGRLEGMRGSVRTLSRRVPKTAGPVFGLSSLPLRLASDETISRDADDALFLDLAAEAARQPGGAVLSSGGGHGQARFSLAAWAPAAVLTAKGRSVRLDLGGRVLTAEADPFAALDELLAALVPDFPAVPPFSGGLVGYLGYELKNVLERLPQTAADETGLPDLFLSLPTRMMVHDREARTLRRLTLDAGLGPAAPPASPAPGPAPDGLRSDFTPEGYQTAVGRIRELIGAGEVYQVNLSQRFAAPSAGDPFDLWKTLLRRNPAPFFAFVNAGDHAVLSTSPERFLRRRGREVEARPIKGTRPRGADPVADAALAADLSGHPKDDAELSMIVDLLRNDLGRVCLPGSVRVAGHKLLESYANVHHLVSVVRGELPEGTGHADLLRATFPCGSVTGCPRIRAMEIIDALEPCARHAYTGAVGYLGLHDNLDLNVAIRTAVVHGPTLRFHVGGGVVWDSDPEAEYRETLHKGRTFFESLGGPP